MRLKLLIGLLAGGLCTPALASPPSSAEPEVFMGSPRSPAVLKSGILGLSPSLRIDLPAPGEDELAALDPDAVPPIFGIGRVIPADQQMINGPQLAWSPLSSGGRVAVFSVSSPGARSLRLQLDLAELPPGMELRFYAPFSSAEVTGSLVTGEAGVGDGIWSPTVSGDTLAVEVFLPTALRPAMVSIPVTRLSHMAADPSKASDFHKDLNDIGGAQPCHIDVQCRTVPEAARNSVAKMVITDAAGGAGFCTGTLLADNDPNTQVPYFLTAHHCGVGDPAVAANIAFFWGFETAACNGPAPGNVIQTGGGGTPLSSSPSSLGNDHALLRLNQNPPNGSTLSGWVANRPAPNNAVVGIHHPNGDLKKVSQGSVIGYASITPGPNGTYSSYTDGVGPYLNVQWQEGITEGGSSGSAIWLGNSENQPNGPYVVGAQLGGGSACNDPQADDQYGSFDLTYKATRLWLDGSSDHTTVWYDPSRNGQGIQLLQNGNSLWGAWYVYNGNGQPIWRVFQTTIDNNTATAPLLRFSGGSAPGSPTWTNPTPEEAGQATVTFSPTSPTEVTFSYNLDGATDTLNLVPFRGLAAGGYTGVWFDPTTNGQGVQLVQTSSTVWGVWYNYDVAGVGRWYVFTGEIDNTFRVTTNLLSFTGPALGQPWNANQVQNTPAGQVSLITNPANPSRITMQYTIGNAQGSITLQPFNI